MDKLDLLKKYVALQAEDHGLWFDAKSIDVAYIQQELRNTARLIESGTVEEIEGAITSYQFDLLPID